MKHIGADLVDKGRRVVIIQLLTTLAVATVFFVWSLSQGTNQAQGTEQAIWAALSASYGGLASVVLALLSIRGFKRANEFALSEPKKSMTILYVSAVQRFVAVLVLLGTGLGLLKLEPLAVLIGFVLAQASYLMGVRDRKVARNPDKKL
ncbi:hypothetical protein [Kaarinaea lacus]